MKRLGRKLAAICAGMMLVFGGASSAWAEGALTDIAEMGLFIDGALATDHPEVVYDGKPAEPSVVIVPPLAREKLEELEIPKEARSVVAYQYEITPIGGERALAAEITSFDSSGMCLSTNMFAKFSQNAPAEAFLKIIERDYGDAFLKGSVDDATTYALVNMRPSSVDKTSYEKALHELLLAPAVDLVEGSDYSVAYGNNDEPGTATVTVTGIGDYSGIQTAEFEIVSKGAVSMDSDDSSGVATKSSPANASSILSYVLLCFLIIVVLVIALVLWRGAKTNDM